MPASEEVDMFVVTGITGKAGGAVAKALLQQGHAVRAVVRSADQGEAWLAVVAVAVADGSQ
jgi:NAD(P)H dehydrogenase (quinone)